MAGNSRRSWAIVAGFAALAALRGCAGDSSPDGPVPGGPARAALLASVGPNVVLPSLEAVDGQLQGLKTTIEGWQDAIATAGDAAGARSQAQAAWGSAMEAWQVVEVLQFGPTGSSLSVHGGQDLRDGIYSWPSSLACRVDQEVVALEYGEPGFVAAQLPHALGLDAVEYLLFRDDDGNDCDALAAINGGDWQALDPDEIDRRRADYADVLVQDLVARSAALLEAWSPGGGDFGAELGAAGQGSAVYDDDQDALDDLFGGLFYLELMAKDRKLARPLGLRDCLDATCPDDLEHRWANFGAQAIAANLRGFRLLFHGGDDGADGFDDLLRAIDQGDLVEGIEQALDAAEAAAEAVQPGLNEALADDPESVLALHDAIKDLTDLLKGDFALFLTLRIPSEAAGDND